MGAGVASVEEPVATIVKMASDGSESEEVDEAASEVAEAENEKTGAEPAEVPETRESESAGAGAGNATARARHWVSRSRAFEIIS